MDTQVRFPKFIATLKELGASVGGAAFLADAPGTWASLPFETRAACLSALGVEMETFSVTIRLGKVPDAPTSLEAILVIFEGDAKIPTLEALPAEAASEPAPDAEPSAEAAHAEPAHAEPAAAAAPEAAEAKAPERKKGRKQKGEPQAPEPAPVTQPLMVLPDEPALPATAAPPKPAAKGGGFFSKFGKKEKEAPKATEGPKEATPAAAEKPAGVTEIPPLTDPNLEQVEIYAVQEPYAFVRILHDKARQENIYEVIEPRLSEREKNILDFIEHTIVDVIEVGLSALNKEQAAELLYKHVDEVIYDYSIVLNPISREKILYYILRDFLGFGKLDPMMRDEYIEDISCDGPGIPIFLYHRRHESIKSNTTFVGDDELDSFVIKMAQRSGKHVSIAEPLLDATLPDGSRLNATLSDEVTDGGSTFTIRKFKEDPFTVPDLVRFGTMNEDLLAYWWLAVQNGASAIYAGGTASGKTTSLNAILLFIPPQMKIVSIEDTREINLPHENWIAGVTRSGFGPRDNNGRQAGEIDMFTLLKAALRQRPEYILVGEVRGQEATALFQAMATGHTAYGTMHADSTEAVIHRLESDPISIPRSLLEALDVVSIQIQTRIGDKRVRRTKELVEIVGLDPHTREILTNQVFTWSPATDEFEFSGVSYVLERIQIERNMGESDMKDEFDRRKRVIRWMVDNNIRSLEDVGRIIATYYRNPAAVLAMIEQPPASPAEAMKALVPVEVREHEPMALELVPEEAQNGPQ
ncbi:MAG TPA: type II/IV secretion system ATPase subunit [Candidatus Thermoplasmatota archaeon]|nr:type II/IV secretion system ATPase subunit [Candidatus Thermoplasmatota archaeon]